MDIISTPQSDDDKKCAPDIAYSNGSCFSIDALETIVKEYNKNYHNDKILLSKTKKIINPGKYKSFLVDSINDKFNKNFNCNKQKCWFEQKFLKSLNNLERSYMRPFGPSGTFKWLDTFNITNVMEQYSKKYPEFKYLGTVPSDFINTSVSNISKNDFKQDKNDGIYKYGIVMNLDNSSQSGSHWVALFVDLKNGKIYFSDSGGSSPPKPMSNYMNTLYDISKKLYNAKPVIDYNEKDHQKKNTECGVYSMHFIISMLNGKTLDEYEKYHLPDNKIAKCRKKYFRNEDKKN